MECITRDVLKKNGVTTCVFLNEPLELFDGFTNDPVTIDGIDFLADTFYATNDVTKEQAKRALSVKQRAFHKTRVLRRTYEVKHG